MTSRCLCRESFGLGNLINATVFNLDWYHIVSSWRKCNLTLDGFRRTGMTDTETVNETGARDEGESPSIPESSLFPWLYKLRGSGLQKLIDRLRGRKHQAAHVEQKRSGSRFPTGRIVFSAVHLAIVLFVFLALVFMSVKLLQWAINGNDPVDNIQPYSFDDLFSHDYRDTLLRQPRTQAARAEGSSSMK